MRRRSLSQGGTEADLPPLSEMPSMDAPLADIEAYFPEVLL